MNIKYFFLILPISELATSGGPETTCLPTQQYPAVLLPRIFKIISGLVWQVPTSSDRLMSRGPRTETLRPATMHAQHLCFRFRHLSYCVFTRNESEHSDVLSWVRGYWRTIQWTFTRFSDKTPNQQTSLPVGLRASRSTFSVMLELICFKQHLIPL